MNPENEPHRPYRLKLFDAESEALCQDGSPAGVYYSKGWGEGLTKVIFFFEGGAWCLGRDKSSTLADCYSRTFGGYGSSKDYDLLWE